MQTTQTKADSPFSSPESFRLTFFCVFVLIIGTIGYKFTGQFPQINTPDGDDAVRLLRVRALLDGQSWFDPTLYAILPPEGIALHWSRYVDAPIAGLILLLTLFVEQHIAEALAAALWPLLLFALYIYLLGRSVKVLFGVPAACFAMMAASFVPLFSQNYFSYGRFDHHNVQVVLMQTVLTAVIVPSRRQTVFFLAGCLASLSLAVGLETIFFVGAVGLLLVARVLFMQPESARNLALFGVGMGLAAPLLLLGQTKPDQWTTHTCDTLSWPWLLLTTATAAFSVSVWLLPRFVEGIWQKRIAITGLGILALMVFVPALLSCLDGPYQDISEEVRVKVLDQISEVRTIFQILRENPIIGYAMLGPLLLACILSLLILRNAKAFLEADQRSRLAELSLFLILLTVLVFFETRTAIFAWTIFSYLFGVIVWFAFYSPRSKSMVRIVGNIVVVMLLISHTWSALVLATSYVFADQSAREAETEEWSPAPRRELADQKCFGYDKLIPLQKVPQGRVLSPVNLGAWLPFYTHHQSLTLLAHRSVEAMSNGVLPFIGNETDLKDTIVRTKADYVIVCKGSNYGERDSVGSKLAQETELSWLEPVTLDETRILMWKVRRQADGTIVD